MAFHGYHITHIDSLAHFFWHGKMYNGRPPHLVSTGLGATVESVELAKDGIVATGHWILDNPNLEELEAECQKRSRWEFMLSIN